MLRAWETVDILTALRVERGEGKISRGRPRLEENIEVDFKEERW